MSIGMLTTQVEVATAFRIPKPDCLQWAVRRLLRTIHGDVQRKADERIGKGCF